MTMLGALRDRFSRSSSVSPGGAVDHDPVPFDGYDRLQGREVIDAMADHSQIELETIETYERSHKSREPVLDKLRWMRGSEPLPGYDTLSVAEIVTAVEDSDLVTIKKVRGYERKFANRPHVLDGVTRALHQRRPNQPPAGAGTTYQPSSSGPLTEKRSARP